jgi:diguanylate cyclase (GGDEF)-like protein
LIAVGESIVLSSSREQENLDYQAKIAELQVRDALTGLYNRSHFIRMTSAEVEKDRSGAVSALLYIRPDRFSVIDERLGPVASDAVLRSLGMLVEEQCGKHSVVARFGGNIFTALVVRRSFSHICKLAENLVEAISTSVFSAGPLSTSMTASIGMVELSECITDSTQAFSLAQAAAKQSRQAGGDRMQVNRSLEMDEYGNLQDAGWVRKIRTALEDNAFHLVYQPIASLMGASINNVDVLVRMLDKEGEDILPGEFMPAAERTGLMPEIDRWVIAEALEVAAQRTADGKQSVFFLRISEASLREEGFIDWLGERALSYDLSPKSIVLQVSESFLEHNISRIRRLVQVCAELGFQLAVANVGVADNCLQLIKLVAMDYLVIDGSFMENLEDEGSRIQLEEIVAAAREKQVATIGSRVENAAELSALCHMGIDYIVGYHVQEPEETIAEDIQLPD